MFLELFVQQGWKYTKLLEKVFMIYTVATPCIFKENLNLCSYIPASQHDITETN